MGLLIMMGIFAFGVVIGIPVAFALGIGAVSAFYFEGLPLIIAFQRIISGINVFSLLAIPFFIFAGFLMEKTGLVASLFKFADAIVGWVPGGFAYATLLSAVLFGAISGSSTAMAAAMSVIAYPELVKRGYPKWMAAGVIASAGGDCSSYTTKYYAYTFWCDYRNIYSRPFLCRNNTWFNVSYE